MKQDEVKRRAFAMPLTSPAYPIGPYRFYNREFLVITYRTDPAKLRELVPEPLQVDEPLVKFEFIRMPDSTGFGDYTESGQVIPVSLRGRKGSYSHCMFLNDHPAHRGRPRAVGLSQKAREPHAAGRDRHAGRHAGLRPGARRHRHHGLQAQVRRSRRGQGLARGAEFPAQDHAARGRHAAHLRTGRISLAGRRAEGRLDRTGCADAHGPMRSRRWPNCRCSRWSRRLISSPISRSDLARWCTIISA